MLGRLLSGAGMMKGGQMMIRSGLSRMKSRANAPAAAASSRRAGIIQSVREKTRGLKGANDKALYSKVTGTGQKRRAAAAMAMRVRRGYVNAAPAIRAAQKARSQAIVKNVKGVTRSIVPAAWIQKHGKNATSDKKSRQLNRQHLASFLRQARQAPTQGYGHRSAEVFNLQKKRKFQGPKI